MRTAFILSLLVSTFSFPAWSISDKPPEFIPSERTQKKIQQQSQQANSPAADYEALLKGHNPFDHDHDHDDTEDLDHDHDDPRAHQKQIEALEKQGYPIPEKPWWQLW